MTNALIIDIRKHGHRITRIREAITDLLLQKKQPITVPDLMIELGKNGFSPNKTTIYREMSFLLSVGIVREIALKDRKKYYEIITDEHHHHAVCIKCNGISDVVLGNDLCREEENISAKTGFTVLHHALEFFGICNKCNQ